MSHSENHPAAEHTIQMFIHQVWQRIQGLRNAHLSKNAYRLKTTAAHGPARIFYIAPDLARASWGIGTMYHHVRILRAHGFNAFIMHAHSPFVISWMAHQIPVVYADDPTLRIGPEDLLVVTEVFALDKKFTSLNCRKVVLVQNSFNIIEKNSSFLSYKAAGYSKALTVMAHLKKIVETHHGIEAFVTPYFIAPYFYLPNHTDTGERKKRILLYPKLGETKDYLIFKRVLLDALRQIQAETQVTWEVLELSDYTHEETAALMRDSIFFINVNYYEALNSSVPEAMAAGCICFCYDAFGPLDFLQDGKNAFVYPNHHVYPLLDGLLATLKNYLLTATQQKLSAVREQAHQTAQQFSERETEKHLVDFYRGLGSSPLSHKF